MPKQNAPTVVGRGLGGELRQLRKAKGLTGAAVSARSSAGSRPDCPGWRPASRASRPRTSPRYS